MAVEAHAKKAGSRGDARKKETPGNPAAHEEGQVEAQQRRSSSTEQAFRERHMGC